jgi:hypothetical protein
MFSSATYWEVLMIDTTQELNMSADGTISVSEFASWCRVSKVSAYHWIKAGIVPGVFATEKGLRLYSDAVSQWIRDGKPGHRRPGRPSSGSPHRMECVDSKVNELFRAVAGDTYAVLSNGTVRLYSRRFPDVMKPYVVEVKPAVPGRIYYGQTVESVEGR